MKSRTRRWFPGTIWSATILIGFSVIAVSSLAGDSLRLDQVIRETLANNGQLLAAKQMSLSARAKARSAGAWDDPMLMLGVNNLPTSGSFTEDAMTMTMVGISQSIPLAGQKRFGASAARKEAEAALAMSQQTAVDLMVEARNGYYELYFSRLILAQMRGQRELYVELVATATDRFRIGLGGQEDVTAAQAAAFRFGAQIRSAEQEVLSAQYRLDALRGVVPSESDTILTLPVEEALSSSSSAWVSSALQNYPELKRLSFQREGYELSARGSRRMRWPMLTISGAYGFRRDGPAMDGVSEQRGDMVSFQAGLSLPLFAGKREGQMARSMEHMGLGAEAQKSQMERDITAQLRSLFSRAVKLQESIDGYANDVIPAADQSYQGALASYMTGKMTLGNLLNFVILPIDDRITLARSRLDLARAISESMRYTTDPATLPIILTE